MVIFNTRTRPVTVTSTIMAVTSASATATKADSTDSTDTSQSSTEDKSEVLKAFSSLVEALRRDITASKPHSQTLGRLKMLDRAIVSLEATPSAESVDLVSSLCELAVLLLPDDTRKYLESCECGSDIALELVRRNLTQLPALAKRLYNATSDDLSADKGLNALHLELGSSLNLYGAFTARGINPRKRPWALSLTQKFSSLSEMRRMSWHRLARLVGLSVASSSRSEVDDDIISDEEQVGSTAAAKANGHMEPKPPTAVPPVRQQPSMPRGEMMVLQQLFSAGADTAPIRKQALDFGLGLLAADQLEQANITTARELTDANIRSFQSKLKVPGMTQEEISAALHSMLANKSETSTPPPEEPDEDEFFGSYETNEELVAAAGGGMALYGVNFFPNEMDVTSKPYAPLLVKPTYIEMAGASASFEASVLHSTELSMASTFTKTTENGGISVAQASTTSWGVNASVSGFGGAASVETSVDKEGKEEENTETTMKNAFSENHKKTTTSATMVETIMCPMKSFRIPVCNMKMSEEALDSALCVDTLLKARQFLDTFGSHVSNGRHLLGGIFFRTITMTSESEVDTSTLLAAASTQMQKSRVDSSDIAASAGGGTIGVTAKASASFGSASSSGVINFHSSAGQEESAMEDSRAMFQTYVRSMGPNVATPELFAEALFTDTSSWTVIDRGPFEALVPITEVMENMVHVFDDNSPGKTQLENAINLVTVAWQQRATVWKPLLNDPAVPVSLRNMIGRSFATQDAHDQLRAAVLDLFEIMELDPSTDITQTAGTIGDTVVSTAEEMQTKPPGEADFFNVLESKITSACEAVAAKFAMKRGTKEWITATRRAKKLSFKDWCGFDLIWKRRNGTQAIKDTLENYLLFEKATLRYGESVTIDSPIVSVNEKFRLEMFENVLRVVDTDSGAVKDVLFECDGMLDKKTNAHLDTSGAFVIDHTMITGFNHTETKVVLWIAPNTEGNKGSYCRMLESGEFVVFNKHGKRLWST